MVVKILLKVEADKNAKRSVTGTAPTKKLKMK